MVARFLREGGAAAKIRSEHVAQVIDVGTIPGDIPCIVLEFLEGCDLAYELKQRGPLRVDLAVDYVMQALEAIAEAHKLSIVHRDLRPSNLFVARRSDGQTAIKVIDFGVSKSLANLDQTALTQRHSLVGSPEYMSPEQARNAVDIDTRTDIWSMGVVLYELLCGMRPFEGKAYLDILAKVLDEDPLPMSQTGYRVPRALEQIVRRCLERDRDKRYQTAGELACALLPFGTERARSSYENIVGTGGRPDAEVARSTITPPPPPLRNRAAARRRRVVSVAWGPVPSIAEMARRSKSDPWIDLPKMEKKKESARPPASLGKAIRRSDVLVWVLCVAVLVLCAVVFDHIRTSAAAGDGTRHLPPTAARAGLGSAP
jgi:serine/threonine-protein kinase